ncbi:MFS transporter [bacterium]|nr:MFS transporter [bacterium]
MSPELSKRARFYCKLTLLLASSLTIMSGATVAASLPRIQAHFAGQPYVELLTRLILTTPALAIVLFSPVAGWITDRFGRKRLLWSSMILYGIAGAGGGLVDNIYAVLISRFLLGLGVAGVMTPVVALIGDYFDGEERGRFIGTQSAFIGFGGVVFVALGGWLASISWRAPFLIYAIAFTIIPLVFATISEPVHEDAGLSKTERGSLAKTRKIPLEIKKKAFFIYAVIFSGFIQTYTVPVQGPFYLENEFSATSTQVGLAISGLILAAAILSLNFQRIKRHVPVLGMYAIAFSAFGLGSLAFSRAPTFPLAMASLFLAGSGLGLIMPTSNVWLLQSSPSWARGRLVGGLTTAVFLGQFCSPLLSQPLVQTVGVRSTFLVIGIGVLLLGIAFAVSQLVRERRQRKRLNPA